ncbi:MAG: hypothetical protein ACREM1_09955 [Longimicrobiales bacterium]
MGILFAASATWACSGASEHLQRTSVRDSSGVVIVESASPLWPASQGWQVTPQPAVEIGAAEGAPEFEFQTILGLTRLANGNIVVGNRGTRELRFFSPEGQFIRAVGRDGEGPGEFRTFNGVYPYRADSLIIWDYRLFRWSVFDSAGAFARILRPARPGMNPRSLSPLADGSLIIADNYLEDAGEQTVDYIRFFRFSPEGELLDSLGIFRSSERFRPANGDSIAMSRIFGSTLLRAGAPEGFLLGFSAEYEVVDHAADGQVRRRIQWLGPDRTVTLEDVAAYRSDFIARQGTSQLGQQFARFVSEVPAADQFPAYSVMVRDRVGNVWLATYPRPDRSGPRTWTVLDPDGRWLGGVELPERLSVWDIGDRYVLGVMDDELGVEHVRMYELNKQD